MKGALIGYAAFALAAGAAGMFALIHFPSPPRATGAPLQQQGLPLSFDPQGLAGQMPNWVGL